jgi:hypothetical protein
MLIYVLLGKMPHVIAKLSQFHELALFSLSPTTSPRFKKGPKKIKELKLKSSNF